MSTRSAIILKVRQEDIGKKLKFDLTKLPKELPLKGWPAFEVSDDLSEEVTIHGEYIGIYCHWDGYLEGVGESLREFFNDYDTILNLIVGGDCSCLCNEIIRYGNRRIEEWKYIKPKQGTLNEVKSQIDFNYVYVFDNDKWICQNDENW